MRSLGGAVCAAPLFSFQAELSAAVRPSRSPRVNSRPIHAPPMPPGSGHSLRLKLVPSGATGIRAAEAGSRPTPWAPQTRLARGTRSVRPRGQTVSSGHPLRPARGKALCRNPPWGHKREGRRWPGARGPRWGQRRRAAATPPLARQDQRRQGTNYGPVPCIGSASGAPSGGYGNVETRPPAHALCPHQRARPVPPRHRPSQAQGPPPRPPKGSRRGGEAAAKTRARGEGPPASACAEEC